MIKKAKFLLVKHDFTLNKLASKTGLSVSTLSYDLSQPVEQWRIGFLFKLSNALKEKSNKLFMYLTKNEKGIR